MNTAVYNGSGKSVEAADTFIFKEKKTRVRVYCADIVFFESDGHYITLHMKSGEVHSIRCTMSSLAEMMDKKSFVRIHRGIMVNLSYIQAINKNDVLLNSIWGSVPVSRPYKEKLEETFNTFCAKNDTFCAKI